MQSYLLNEQVCITTMQIVTYLNISYLVFVYLLILMILVVLALWTIALLVNIIGSGKAWVKVCMIW